MPAPIQLLRADGVSHSYAGRRILDDLNLVVPAGERLGLIGENGAGKSTLLRILAGAEEPDAGLVSHPAETGLLWQEVQHDPDDTVGDLLEAALSGCVRSSVSWRTPRVPCRVKRFDHTAALERRLSAPTCRATDARIASALAGLGVDAIPRPGAFVR